MHQLRDQPISRDTGSEDPTCGIEELHGMQIRKGGMEIQIVTNRKPQYHVTAIPKPALNRVPAAFRFRVLSPLQWRSGKGVPWYGMSDAGAELHGVTFAAVAALVAFRCALQLQPSGCDACTPGLQV